MKKIFLIIVLLCVSLSLSSQNNNFYYANGMAQYWEEDRNSVNIIVGNIESIDTLVCKLKSQFRDVNDEILFSSEDNNIIINSSSLSNRNLYEIIDNISISSDEVFFSYSKLINDSHIWLTNEVYVKLKDSLYYSTHFLPVISQQQNIDIHYEGDNEYRIVCGTEEQVISIANQLYDTNYVVYSTPDFYSEVDMCTNDEYYDEQWNLRNIGDDGGTAGVDIKAEEAWNFLNKVIGEPGSNIKVAVIDDGVEEHEDLYLNGGVSKVLEGYTANGHGTGRPLDKHFHGQMCAGVIAAVHNNIGVAGVASNARIVPFRIYKNLKNQSGNLLLFSNAKIANTIKKAWNDYSCPVLSNSWRLFNSNDKITDAIEYVSVNGRNGKGCFVVYSSGNVTAYPYNTLVNFPANLDFVMAVGAIDKNGIKYDYSNFGDKLDIVAPSAVPTIDRMGNSGHCDNGTLEPDYNMTFEGTSAACPHVSGVAALMLSVNPDLTRLQMTDIIKRTAQKVGGYNYQVQNNDPQMTWCPETGYGLIDAHRAVVESLLYGHNITLNGSREMYLCNDYTFSCDIINPEAFSYEWTYSNNLAVISTNLNNINLKPIGSGNAWVKLNIYSENRLIRTLEADNIVINEAYVGNLVPLSLSNLYITEDTTLNNNNHFLVFNAIVEKDVTLTITGNVYCSDMASIKIKPGGKLIIDGGLLTSVCYTKKWQGIEVWGVDTLHQYIVDGKYKQGYLELKNGATIENAICAVELWQPGNYHSEGGIIHATDAVFRNNAKAVHAINYTNYVPTNGNSSSYNSWFKNCEFIVDSDYIGDETFHKHIDLDRVNGISFKGCSFSVDRNVENVSQWCSGIAAYNAGFAVNSYCSDNTIQPCLDEYLTRSSFSGFHSGIYVRGGSTSYTYNVRNAEFTNNDRGIYAENTGYGTILFNDFIVGTDADCSFGIYMNETTGFCIEENNFIGDEKSSSYNYGIGIHNSASANNIYRNTFQSLDCGNVAVGVNIIGKTSSMSKQGGLTYACNTNISNINDFCVVRENSSGDIAQSQGSSTLPAGNTFSGSQYHFYNDGESVINYYYNTNNANQTPNSSRLFRITSIPTSSVNPCNPHYGNGSVVRSDEELEELETIYDNSILTFNELNNVYTSRIDGGDTQAELLDINTATADDASRLRSQLLGLSPYLSQEVLTTAASRNDVFSTSTLFEILSANPDELKKDTLISYLENKDNPMPEYMTELLREIANGSTARTALESQMAKSEREYILAAGDIVRSNLNSEESDNEELRLWLGNMNDMASDRLAIATYIQESDFENALALAETLPNVYALQGAELEEHNDYISILRLYETLDESGRDIMQLTETETEMLEEIADNGSGSSQMMAYAILSQNDEALITAVNCPVLPTANNNSKRGTAHVKSDMAAAMGMKADFAPNPATAWTEIDYTLPLDEEKASLVITNALGVNVMTVELNGNHGRKTLYIEQLPAGVYTYFVKCGEYTITGKLMKK